MFTLDLTIRDGDGASREVKGLVILKSLDREARVKAVAEAIARLFEAIERETK